MEDLRLIPETSAATSRQRRQRSGKGFHNLWVDRFITHLYDVSFITDERPLILPSSPPIVAATPALALPTQMNLPIQQQQPQQQHPIMVSVPIQQPVPIPPMVGQPMPDHAPVTQSNPSASIDPSHQTTPHNSAFVQNQMVPTHPSMMSPNPTLTHPPTVDPNGHFIHPAHLRPHPLHHPHAYPQLIGNPDPSSFQSPPPHATPISHSNPHAAFLAQYGGGANGIDHVPQSNPFPSISTQPENATPTPVMPITIHPMPSPPTPMHGETFINNTPSPEAVPQPNNGISNQPSISSPEPTPIDPMQQSPPPPPILME